MGSVSHIIGDDDMRKLEGTRREALMNLLLLRGGERSMSTMEINYLCECLEGVGVREERGNMRERRSRRKEEGFVKGGRTGGGRVEEEEEG